MNGRAAGGRAKRFALAALMLVLVAVLTALGLWQVERRAWKLDLIARVEARVEAEPAAPPSPEAWSTSSPAEAEYRNVRLEGRFESVRPALVQAVTERGGGDWVLAPFRTREGFAVLVNRGFVPVGTSAEAIAPPPEGDTTVTGLLRLTEPEGGFLQSNDPAADRWYSRDVAAIGASRGVSGLAPYFVDARTGAEGVPSGSAAVRPVGGLTVLRFPNNHLVYALTWFGMAALALVGLVLVLRSDRRTASEPPA
ncbi:surfeit locus 1 family protein [Aureimonas jatrophae]|uniref:SURF1-like protein n=2 Tax=Aureimonas jatrophae TaxID=1166073 RepID=A0A1H0F3Y7_9HYPH|nr:surfeit locus 1 family protein [Aureimonas jatrophae]SDN89266.1 surfeit locus 1 family protein [Aureimonas jatrophae]